MGSNEWKSDQLEADCGGSGERAVSDQSRNSVCVEDGHIRDILRRQAGEFLLSGVREDREELRSLTPSASRKGQLWSGARATHGRWGFHLHRPRLRWSADICGEVTGRQINGSGVQEVVCAADINLGICGMRMVFRTIG